MTTLTLAGIIWAALGLAGIGVVLVALLFAIPATRATARGIVPTFISALTVLAALLAGFALGDVALIVFLTALAARTGWEAARTMGLSALPLGIALALATVAVAAVQPDPLYLLLAFVAAFLARSLRPVPLADWLLFPTLPLLCLTCFAITPETRALALAAYIVTETFDSYALLCGKALGRRKAFPVLSPNKTIEGLLGGALALVLTACGLAYALGGSLIAALMFALLMGALTLAGDLWASQIKRRAGVKDYPVLHHTQGGLLDTFDSWIMTGLGGALILTLMG